MKAEYSIFTDKGGRAINEDCAEAVRDGKRYCFIVCDGLGGHGMGDVASRLVTDRLKEYFYECDTEKFAKTAMFAAQKVLLTAQLENPKLKNMRTTAVILLTDGEKGIVLHIGDSRMYRFREGHILSRTTDHSIPQMLCRLGEISEQEIRLHPDRNKLLRALGDDGEALRFDRSDFDVKEGDAFLLCSDGFWEPVTENIMEKYLSDRKKAEKWLSSMSKYAMKNGKGRNMDNCTALAVVMRG